MSVEIKDRWNGGVICTGDTLRDAVEKNRRILWNANLIRADLSGANLTRTYLGRANLTGADLTGANLTLAYLDSARLKGAKLSNTDLTRADLTGADLRDADLSGANLDRTNLTRADLTGADLTGANLSGAGLIQVSFSRANLAGARICWSSNDLIAELLKRAAGENPEKLKVAGLMLVTREKWWLDSLMIGDPLTDWALDVLSEWVQKGDGAPDCLRSRVTRQEDK